MHSLADFSICRLASIDSQYRASITFAMRWLNNLQPGRLLDDLSPVAEGVLDSADDEMRAVVRLKLHALGGIVQIDGRYKADIAFLYAVFSEWSTGHQDLCATSFSYQLLVLDTILSLTWNIPCLQVFIHRLFVNPFFFLLVFVSVTDFIIFPSRRPTRYFFPKSCHRFTVSIREKPIQIVSHACTSP